MPLFYFARDKRTCIIKMKSVFLEAYMLQYEFGCTT